MDKNRFYRNGFTLVELSIVLVILGLLVGGVLTGQSLIRAAELRSITSQHSRYITAVNAFKDKYFAIPGDMANAQSFWGIAHATPATCVTTIGTGTQTCNGNGDGAVVTSTGSNESFRFWQHLANAGLIEGNFTGVTQGANPLSSSTANSPTGRINSTLWFAFWWPVATRAYVFDGTYDNFFEFGGTMTDYDPNTAVLKPEETWNIDTKMDDGKPATGKVVARAHFTNALSSCTDTATSSNFAANYLLTNNTPACNLIFPRAF